jgi:hypothetical protein
VCTIDFLRQILDGRKQYFLNKEVPYIYMQKMERVTVKNVLDKVYERPEVRVYLPDYTDHADKYMNRDFLFSIVNKLDPTFFTRVTSEVGVRRRAKQAEVKETQIEIKPDLLKILQEAQREYRQRESHGNARALQSMLASKKKRKRREMQQDHGGLETEFKMRRFKD